MPPRRLATTAEITALPQVLAFVLDSAEQTGLGAEARGRLELAVEEVFVNLCTHAYPVDAPGWAEISTHHADDRLTIEIRDGGIPFDGTRIPTPDLEQPLAARPVGGLGWVLIRRLVDGLDYRRLEGCNLLRLSMRLPDLPRR
ncbi:serine/threonine protein kinase [Marichromatium purpuratum 984]|uniref:Serine/threonine protein kinase n=1 Tax=Marichromatium purpuratum 984 TaxID=765910 RepID=W0E174_MARPU|nr:ATP-binding protein [Marichromatium purpuratum]AHF04625.1 serine/threonine protein kinase [Marichromatium purpuratum 984]